MFAGTMPAKLDLFLASPLPLDSFAIEAGRVMGADFTAAAGGFEAVLDEQRLFLRPVEAALDSAKYARQYQFVIVLDARGQPQRRLIALGRVGFDRFRAAGYRVALTFGTDIEVSHYEPPSPNDDGDAVA